MGYRSVVWNWTRAAVGLTLTLFETSNALEPLGSAPPRLSDLAHPPSVSPGTVGCPRHPVHSFGEGEA